MSIDSADGSTTLPLKPSRDNSGRGCKRAPGTAADDRLPDHITACECETHDGVCMECYYKITIGADGVEYGHARATNRRADADGVRRDCPHRPSECNPGGRHEWPGYDEQGGERA